MVYDIMSDAQRKHYEENLECDFSFAVPNLARFRVNAFRQERGAAAVFRTIPSKVLSLEDLKAPKVFAELTTRPRGLILVTGPTGSGKSTTLAAMVDYINENQYGHILTIEDPIEFVHESKKCLINQREVGPHTLSFANALRSALREDPDVILVGEMRDLETIRLALTAAETGHLVFGTLHTSSAAKTVDRIIDVFPAAEKEMVRAMLSESLVAVISQTLLKTQGRPGPHRRARDHDRHPGDQEPDPREQGGADVLRHPDRSEPWACRPSISAWWTWSSATWSPWSRRVPRAVTQGLFPGDPRSRGAAARPPPGGRGTAARRPVAAVQARRLVRATAEHKWNANGHEVHPRAARPAREAEGLGSLHHRRFPAGPQDRRQDHAGLQDRADSAAHHRAGAQRHERQAGRRVRGQQGVQLRDRPAGHRALPRQRLRAAGPRRHGAAHDHHPDPDVRRARPAAGAART